MGGTLRDVRGGWDFGGEELILRRTKPECNGIFQN